MSEIIEEPVEDEEEATEAPQTADEPEEEEEAQTEFYAPESAAQQPVEAGMSMEDAMEASKGASGDWKRFKARTVERWKPIAGQLMDCPLCLDQHKGMIDLTHAGQYPPEIVRVVQEYLGLVVPVQLSESRYFETCPECQGEGNVLTGSHLGDKRTAPCPDCGQKGYLPTAAYREKYGKAAQTLTAAATLVDANGDGGERDGLTGPLHYQGPLPDDIQHDEYDEFQQPRLLPDGRDNPNYGRRPAYWVQVEPWGNTVGLSANDMAVA